METEDQGHGPEAGSSGVPREAEGLIGVAGLAIALVLLALVPFATKPQPPDKSWFLAPMNAPLAGIMLVGFASLILSARLVADYRRSEDRAALRRRALWAFGDLGPAFGFALLFCGYLFAMPWLGFALGTLVFGQACLWFAGLHGRKWMLWNLTFVAVTVLVLRFGMGLWFPQAALFDWLPASVGNALGRYL